MVGIVSLGDVASRTHDQVVSGTALEGVSAPAQIH